MSEMSASAERVCGQCGKNLDGEPAILVNGECFCFFHAKRAYQAALADRLKKEQSLNANFREQLAEFERNKKEHEQVLRNRQDRRFRFSIDKWIFRKA